MAQDEEQGQALGHSGRHSEHGDLHRLLRAVQAIDDKLDTILGHVKRTEKSVGLQQKAWERNERKFDKMATNQDVLDAVDAIDTNIEADLAAEKAEIMAAIAKAAQGPLDTIAAMQTTIDDLRAQVAAGNDVTPILARLQALGVKASTGVKALVEQAPPVEPPTPEPTPEPVPAPPSEGRRR